MVLRTSSYHFRICDLNYMATYNNICYVSRDFSLPLWCSRGSCSSENLHSQVPKNYEPTLCNIPDKRRPKLVVTQLVKKFLAKSFLSPLNLLPSRMSPLHILTSRVFGINFNIIILSVYALISYTLPSKHVFRLKFW